MLLRKLAYPARGVDIELQFGWEKSRYSRITNTLASLIYDKWKHLLYFDAHRLTPQKLRQFALVIEAKGAPVTNVWGFVDGTLRKTARPVKNQRIVYNGWKRIHAIKFHSLITPDGLHVHVYGPVEGRRHDETLYRQSGLSELLDKYSWGPDGESLAIFGDSGYG
ncbi:hypothetical protein BD410DRAFT_700488, partial [Rickenella mellea]